MQKKISLSLVLLLGLLFHSCSKNDNQEINPASLQSLPVLTTTSITDKYTANPKSGGDITSDGGSPIIARGIVWSINPDPVITDSKSIDGTGIGTFTSQMSGLQIGTKYYVRAYATNSFGTAYGNTREMTTLDTSKPKMTAKIGSTNFNDMFPINWTPNSRSIDVITYPNSTKEMDIEIEGETKINLSIVFTLYIPKSKWAPGTYTLHNYVNSQGAIDNQCRVMVDDNGVQASDISNGTITITEYNRSTRRIKGTFSFKYRDVPNPFTTVTNGTFSYALDHSLAQ